MAKLVDILARELEVWPEGATYTQQDADKEIRFHGFGWENYSHDFFIDEMSEDGCSEADCAGAGVKVTRSEWQAAADALKAPAWNGEGLPPVGTVCLTDHEGQEFSVKILAYGDHYRDKCLLAADMSAGIEGKMFGWIADQCEFRPVRTPQQIASEERESAIGEMVDSMLMRFICDPETPTRIGEVCEALYCAGYRKQVAP